MDPRIEFANDVCRLIWQKYEEDIIYYMDEVKPYYDHFKENVRNIYQFIDYRISLFRMYEIYSSSWQELGFESEEACFNENNDMYLNCSMIYSKD